MIEVPEPLAVALWPQLLLIHTTISLSNVLGLTSTRIVSYAIENYPTSDKLAQHSRMPRWLSRLVVKIIAGYLAATTSKIVFGTQAAVDNYGQQLPKSMRRQSLATELIWALPSAAQNVALMEPGPRLVFLGTFEKRKGIFKLLEAWPVVAAQLPTAKLTILGMSGSIDHVRRFASSAKDVTLIENPERAEIIAQLSRSKSLVLFSQPHAGWMEQVGLPIVEGLSVGCEIISSDQTGLSEWLSQHGHEVLNWDVSVEELACAILRSLNAGRSRQEVMLDLPAEDGRFLADKALFSV